MRRSAELEIRFRLSRILNFLPAIQLSDFLLPALTLDLHLFEIKWLPACTLISVQSGNDKIQQNSKYFSCKKKYIRIYIKMFPSNLTDNSNKGDHFSDLWMIVNSNVFGIRRTTKSKSYNSKMCLRKKLCFLKIEYSNMINQKNLDN